MPTSQATLTETREEPRARLAIKNNHTLGAALAVAGILTGLLAFYLLADIYVLNIDGKILDGRPDEAITVQITFAMLGWLGLSAGALWGAVLYGFAKKLPWAWFWGTVAATVQLLAGFFPMIPPSSIGLPAPTVWVFMLALVLWFGMLLIGGVNKKVIALTFVAGLAYVLTYMDGVATISKYQTTTYNDFWKGMYAMAQMVNWWGAAAWAVFIFATLKHKSWAIPLGIFAALMSMMGGYPLAIVNIIEVERFSMFLPGPLISTVLLVVLLLPGTQKLISGDAR
ncbi:MAG: hypothetical protein RRC07_06455 [Anaerolineae bacterium]|nr:hypothetical protein [Anaerolineae bacterium]